MTHPLCVTCLMPVWDEPGVERRYQGRQVGKGWLHFDCPQPRKGIVDDKVRREEQQWAWDEEDRRRY